MGVVLGVIVDRRGVFGIEGIQLVGGGCQGVGVGVIRRGKRLLGVLWFGDFRGVGRRGDCGFRWIRLEQYFQGRVLRGGLGYDFNKGRRLGRDGVLNGSFFVGWWQEVIRFVGGRRGGLLGSFVQQVFRECLQEQREMFARYCQREIRGFRVVAREFGCKSWVGFSFVLVRLVFSWQQLLVSKVWFWYVFLGVLRFRLVCFFSQFFWGSGWEYLAFRM